MPKLLRFMLLFLILLASAAFAHLPPMPDANDSVFTATEIVIVSSTIPHTFKIEKSFRGKLPIGSTIDLPTFNLVTWNKMGDEQPEPLTDSTRVLLFLQPDAEDPKTLAISYWGNAFFFRDVAKIDELNTMTEKALDYYKTWQTARDFPNPQKRLEVLFPYLLHSPGSCQKLTLAELAKLNPASGDYLATLLPTASANDTQSLVLLCRELQTPKSHAAVIAAIDRARLQFTAFLDSRHIKSLDVKAHWNEIPEEVKGVNGIIYYGLAALRSFKDKSDTPYFRDVVPFLLANDIDQPLEECVDDMQEHPAHENVLVLHAIWQDYLSHHYPPENEPLLPIYIARAMAAQNSAAMISDLINMLDNGRAHDSALEALRQISKKNFSSDDQWKAWYAAQPVQM